MRINIETHGVRLTDNLRKHIEQRLQFCLASTGEQVKRTVVELTDTSESHEERKGVLCYLKVKCADMPDVIVEDIEADIFFAINRASDRARRTVQRELNRVRRLSGTSGLHELRMT